ncbi:MAG: DNA-protecting protein DprA [Oscillospiraceae bacterium]
MKIAVIGSRELQVDHLEDYLPEGVTEIVSGGARGVDSCARDYALQHGLKLTELLPEYEKYGRGAPLRRNITIIEYADHVLAFWDGKSRGTKYVIDNCKKRNISVAVYQPAAGSEAKQYQCTSTPIT